MKRPKKPISAGRWIALSFLVLILLGTCLLLLPAASRDGRCCGMEKAAFTATSATCVTGLVLADTFTQWSGFGQAVILVLIEVGGLGFMSMASAVIFLLRKKANMREQMLMAQAISVDRTSDVIRVQKRVLLGSLLIEGLGALFLTVRFCFRYGFFTSLKLGVFHAISAFCNAGFDILGFEEGADSLVNYGKDPWVLLILSLLVIFGGIGFLVWDEVFSRPPRRWSVYTKLVLAATGILLVVGAAAICLCEWNNEGTLGGRTVGEKILAGFFQSVTTRTAGFAAIDQGALTEAGKAVTTFFMLIGGSSGSTAGGLKTVTFTVLILFLWTRVRGREEVHVLGRTVPKRLVLNALMLFGVMVGFSFLGATLLCLAEPVSFTDALYEAVSALATVGLTTGITPTLGVFSHLLLMVYMFLGRVGILTISLGFLRNKTTEQQYRYADTNLLIG